MSRGLQDDRAISGTLRVSRHKDHPVRNKTGAFWKEKESQCMWAKLIGADKTLLSLPGTVGRY